MRPPHIYAAWDGKTYLQFRCPLCGKQSDWAGVEEYRETDERARRHEAEEHKRVVYA
jgi:predicted RNA-binding Zn-ribbon protein involved in translation (DUF1610 family)